MRAGWNVGLVKLLSLTSRSSQPWKGSTNNPIASTPGENAILNISFFKESFVRIYAQEWDLLDHMVVLCIEKTMYTCMCNWVPMLYSGKIKKCVGGNNKK